MRTYMDYKLEKKEWELIGLMHCVLQVSGQPFPCLIPAILCQEPANAQMSFTSEDHPSVSFAIPFLECLGSLAQPGGIHTSTSQNPCQSHKSQQMVSQTGQYGCLLCMLRCMVSNCLILSTDEPNRHCTQCLTQQL